MGLFFKSHRKHDVPRPHVASKKKQPAGSRSHRCHFEQLESRELLSVTPIEIGVVYVEDFSPSNDASTTYGTSNATGADLFEVSFAGGTADTTLSSVTIDLGKASIFDTESGGKGVDESYQLKILSSSGFTITAIYDKNGNALDLDNLELPDGSTSITICFKNFDAADKLVFTVDVDDAFSISQNCEASEFCSYTSYSDYFVQGATIDATFSVGKQTVSISDVEFKNIYKFTDQTLADTLPRDEYFGEAASLYQPVGRSLSTAAGTPNDSTAGAVGTIELAKISGHVYYDVDNDGVRDTATDPTEIGLSTTVSLLNSSGTEVSSVTSTNSDGSTVTVSTATQTTVENDGSYCFYVTAGTYGVKENADPTGYTDGKDTRGSIDGTSDKANTASDSNDTFKAITVAAKQEAVDYDFGEVKPVSISGHVYFDKTSGNVGIEGVTVKLAIKGTDGTYSVIATTTTDEDGYYEFTETPEGVALTAGTYKVIEDNETVIEDTDTTVSSIYVDSTDNRGKVNDEYKGTAENDDITDITLVSGQSGVDYDFHEKGLSISGKAYVDVDITDGTDYVDGTDIVIAGAKIYLLDSNGDYILDSNGDKIYATTDSDGNYIIPDLLKDTYGLKEVYSSTKYLDWYDYPGDDDVHGGKADGEESIVQIKMTSDEDATNYDFTEVLPATISGYVFQDGSTLVLDEDETFTEPTDYGYDGQLTSDDTRLKGITIALYNSDGTLLDTTTTDKYGHYEFTGLAPGYYTIIQLQPDDYVSSVDTAGKVGTLNQTTGELENASTEGVVLNTYTVADDATLKTQYVTAWDILKKYPGGSAITEIYVSANQKGVNYNFSEILVRSDTTPPTPPPPPTPEPPTWPSPYAALPFVEYYSYASPYSIVETVSQPFGGGSGGPGGYTWHLSVVDAGQPREDGSGDAFVQYSETGYSSVSTEEMKQSQWTLADQDGKPIKTLRYGRHGAVPVAGKWDGSGASFVGIFIDGQWFLDLNGDGIWDPGDLWAKLGKKGDQPVSGDWDGDGKTDIGIFGPTWIGDMKAVNAEPGLPDAANPPKDRPKNVPPDAADAAVGWRTMKKDPDGRARSDLIDHVFQYGTKGDRSVVGDWNGDGIHSIGIFRNGTWFLDMDGDGRWSDADVAVEFGQQGDIPIVGDWNGDGTSKLGVYRNGTFHLDTNNNRRIDAADKVFQLGHAGDKPVVGDWNGDGVDKVGVYQENAPAEQQTASAQSGTAVK